MAQDFKILLLESADHQAGLVTFELSKANRPVVVKEVQNRASFLQALEEFHPHLILTDYRLPSFDGLTALALVQEVCPEVPFIFVTEFLSEQLSDGQRTGAAEFGPEIWRVLGHLAEGSLIVFLAPDLRILEFNPGAQRLTGWKKSEVLGKNAVELLVSDEKRQQAKARLSEIMAEKSAGTFDLALQLRDGSQRLFRLDTSLLRDAFDQPLGLLLVGNVIVKSQPGSEITHSKPQMARRITRRTGSFC
jgi:PAS domain S-box-containing protein